MGVFFVQKIDIKSKNESPLLKQEDVFKLLPGTCYEKWRRLQEIWFCLLLRVVAVIFPLPRRVPLLCLLLPFVCYFILLDRWTTFKAASKRTTFPVSFWRYSETWRERQCLCGRPRGGEVTKYRRFVVKDYTTTTTTLLGRSSLSQAISRALNFANMESWKCAKTKGWKEASTTFLYGWNVADDNISLRAGMLPTPIILRVGKLPTKAISTYNK